MIIINICESSKDTMEDYVERRDDIILSERIMEAKVFYQRKGGLSLRLVEFVLEDLNKMKMRV